MPLGQRRLRSDPVSVVADPRAGARGRARHTIELAGHSAVWIGAALDRPAASIPELDQRDIGPSRRGAKGITDGGAGARGCARDAVQIDAVCASRIRACLDRPVAPCQCSIMVASSPVAEWKATPTAVQALADTHDTPYKRLPSAPAGLGVLWIVQLLPLQRSTNLT